MVPPSTPDSLVLIFPDNLANGLDLVEEFNSETDSDYSSYWRDWVGLITTVELPKNFLTIRLRATSSGSLFRREGTNTFVKSTKNILRIDST